MRETHRIKIPFIVNLTHSKPHQRVGFGFIRPETHLSTFEFGGRIFELWRQIWTLLGTNMQQISIVGHSGKYIGLSSEALMSSKLKPAKLACPPNSNIVKCAQVDSGWYWEPAFALGVHMGVQKCLRKIIIFFTISCTKMHDFFSADRNHAFKKRKKTLSLCGDV